MKHSNYMNEWKRHFIVLGLIVSMASATLAVTLSERVQAILPASTKTSKLVSDPPTRIAGITKLIFATCNLNFGSINPHADGLADCPVPGTSVGDNVVATPNNGLYDTMSFYGAIALSDKVRILVRSNFDGTLSPVQTTWSVIVFHK